MVKHIMCYLSSTSLSQPTAYSPNSLRRSSDNFEKYFKIHFFLFSFFFFFIKFIILYFYYFFLSFSFLFMFLTFYFRPVLLQIIHEPLYDFLKMAFTQWPDTQQIVPQPLYSVFYLFYYNINFLKLFLYYLFYFILF